MAKQLTLKRFQHRLGDRKGCYDVAFKTSQPKGSRVYSSLPDRAIREVVQRLPVDMPAIDL